jgi:hypothetical protein
VRNDASCKPAPVQDFSCAAEQVNLFGETINAATALVKAKRIGIGGRGFVGGYYMQPGSGPAGETCRTCKFGASTGNKGKYKKCLKMRHAWTNGAGSDIKLRSPACSGWEKEQVQP